jgi:putative DNA methylase
MATAQRYPKRLIEVDLPIKRISAHARREKSIRHGHISTLHIWWARRPLAACRAVICAALWPDPADEACPPAFRETARKLMSAWAAQHLGLCSPESYGRFLAVQRTPAKLSDKIELRAALFDFIADFANWDNSTSREFLEMSRALTDSAHLALGGASGTRPLVVDPFAGGGSIPLEALRVGADAFASDLNPVAVLLNKVVLEYAPKYGERLADEVRKRGAWIKQEAQKELGALYSNNAVGATPIAYLWARTVLSEAPGEGRVPVEIPLLRSMWLAKKPTRRRAFRWVRDEHGHIATQRRKLSYADGTVREVLRPILEVFEPKKESEVEPGPSAGGSATCPVTGFTLPVERVRSQLASRHGGARDSRLVGVVEVRQGIQGRFYRLPVSVEEAAIADALGWLHKYEQTRGDQDPVIPDGTINHLRGFFNIVLYGMTTWGDAFTPRQLAVLLTLGRLVRIAGESLEPAELATAVEACLALVLGRMADGNSSLARWQTVGEKISNTFGRQALPMVWDFAESNPFCDATRSLESMFDWITSVILHESANHQGGHAEQASAIRYPLPDDSVDAVITDPPYYAAVPYADLSDFFYSWLSPALKQRLPALFSEKLTPKAEECVQLSHRAAMYRNKDKGWFEGMMALACGEARRVTKIEGVGLFVFASKETDAWEAMLAALVNSGWTVTASWPIDTEMSSRLRAQESATLASSIHILCRPRKNADGSLDITEIGDWRDVLQELPRRIHEWMPRLADEGIVGADAIFACLGPALEIFSRYSVVEKASGEVVQLKEYLEQVWAAVAREALEMVFQGADASGFEADARLTAMWLWTLKAGSNGDKVTVDESDDEVGSEEDEAVGKKLKIGGFELEYDAARKIAQGLGAHLEALGSLVEVRGERARLLAVAERTRHLFGKEETESSRIERNKKPDQTDLFTELAGAGSDEVTSPEMATPRLGETTLDRLHQAMILFGAGRGEALKRFLVDGGAGQDGRFWRLAQALSALFPTGTDEKRWVDGVLARKRSLGF